MATPGSRNLVLFLLCVASFSVVFCNMVLAPMIPELAETFDVSTSVAAQGVTAFAFVAGTTGFLAGPLLDRLGRRPVLVSGMAILGSATLATGFAPGIWLLFVSRAVAGVGAAFLMPGIVSTVADHFAYEERGRALAYTLSANTFAQIAGVPAGVVVAGVFSWRLSFVLLGATVLIFTALLAFRLPADRPRGEARREGFASVIAALRDRPAAGTVLSNFVAMVFWQLPLIYMAVFLRDEHGFPTWALGATTMAMGAGVLAGGNVGGRLSDRFGRRPLIIWGTLLAAPNIALALTFAPNGVVALGFIVVFAGLTALRFSSIQALATEIRPGARGTMTSLFAAGMQFAVVIGALSGAVLVPAWGFAVLGIVCMAGYAASLLVFLALVDQSHPAVAAPARTVPGPAPRPGADGGR